MGEFRHDFIEALVPLHNKVKRAVDSLVVRTSDSRPKGLGSMPVPPNTLRVHTEFVLVKIGGVAIYCPFEKFRRANLYCHLTGRPRVTTPNEDRYLAVTAKRNRRSTSSDLFHQLSSATGTTVSRQTMYRLLGHIGLYARKPVRCVPLTATHCRLRLNWSKEHALWTPEQWSCVMFSDKSRFSLQSDSRQTLIWRAPGTRYHQENTIERHRYGGAGGLVWGGIILGSRIDLHVQSVTMTGRIYRDVILEQHVRLFRGTMGAEFLFMDDNARPHRL
ncbi:transposable element Tcb1 transposase [Trichonephila clavipes]|nr:transposable element Tcb1 transposase [Trichonephila clavipes]